MSTSSRVDVNFFFVTRFDARRRVTHFKVDASARASVAQFREAPKEAFADTKVGYFSLPM
jgi:hypothetical protein